MTDEAIEEMGIRDPLREGWLSDVCSLPEEVLVTPSGTVKFPGRERRYVNGDGSLTLTRVEYKVWTKELIGEEIDPLEALREMGRC